MPYSISSKGQVTLPIEIRKRLGVRAGDKVDFQVREGRVMVVPAREAGENPFDKWIGAFPAFSSREEINDWVSDMRGRDPRDEEDW